MKKLCLGTFLKIICQARGVGVRNNKLMRSVLCCIYCETANYELKDDADLNHLKSGHDNISADYIGTVRKSNPQDIYNYFCKTVRPLLNKQLDRQVILAFRNIISDDLSITDDTNLGTTPGYTKLDIISKNRFSYMGLLTNLFIYCIVNVSNIPYQSNIKELTNSFVESFSAEVDSIGIDDDLATTSTPLTETLKSHNFSSVFIEVHHPCTLTLANPSQIRAFHLNVRDCEFEYSTLSKYIKDNIGRYVFSRAKRNEYQLNDDVENIALDATNALKVSKDSSLSSYFPEILLYSFLEGALNAPKIMSKIELQNIGGQYKSKASGIHLLSIDDKITPIYQLVFGASDVLEDLHAAIDSAFMQIKEIKQSSDEEYTIVETNILENAFTPEITSFLKTIIIPQRSKPQYPDTAFGVFIGYNVNIPNKEKTPSNEYINLLTQKMQSDIIGCIPYIQNKIKQNKLSNHSFYIYVLPLDDINKDMITIMNKALGE